MKKRLIVVSIFSILVIVGVVISSHWFWTLPFIPAVLRANFQLNANIIPASDKSRAQFVAINPGFRAEFGDKENPTSAYLRFEKTNTTTKDTSKNADVNANLLDSLAIIQLTSDYQPGLQWQLFNIGIDETQLTTDTHLSQDSEALSIARELLGETIVAEPTDNLETVAHDREKITTQTVVDRFQGYDQVTNMAVAPDVDLKYTVLPGKGINSTIWIGDRPNFDTACLQMLSLTGSNAGCNLPSNKFSFLLQLDNGQKLIHDPLAIDQSQHGTYYVVDEQGHYLIRLGNPTLIDADGQRSEAVTMDIRPGQVGGSAVANFYIVTFTADLGWLIDSSRVFPVQIDSGFYVDGGGLFAPDLATNATSVVASGLETVTLSATNSAESQ